MVLAVLLIVLSIMFIGVWQLTMQNIVLNKQGPAQMAVYANNMMQWHQTIMRLRVDYDGAFGPQAASIVQCDSLTTVRPCAFNIANAAAYNPTAANGSAKLPSNPNAFFVEPLNIVFQNKSGTQNFQRMGDWRSWMVVTPTYGTYVLTLLPKPSVNNTATLQPNNLAPALAKIAGNDVLGIGLVRLANPCSVIVGSTTAPPANCIAEIVSTGSIDGRSTSPLRLRTNPMWIVDPVNDRDGLTAAVLDGAAAIMTRVR